MLPIREARVVVDWRDIRRSGSGYAKKNVRAPGGPVAIGYSAPPVRSISIASAASPRGPFAHRFKQESN